jgi:hypothetical protein
LRQDPLLALLSDVPDPTGQARRRDQDKGCALAGKSTLNRLELTPLDADAASRYKKIVAQPAAMDELLVDLFLEAHDTAPELIILANICCVRGYAQRIKTVPPGPKRNWHA